MNVSKLAEMYEIPYSVLYARLYKLRWSLDKALTTPIGVHAGRRVVDVNLEDLPPLPQKKTA